MEDSIDTNPYVKDDLYFANVTVVGKKSGFYAFRRVTDYMSVLIAIFMSGLIIYMVLCQLPRNLKHYRGIIMIGVIGHYIAAVLIFFAESRVRMINQLVMMAFTGPLSWLISYSQYSIINCIRFFGPAMASALIPVQFYFRFLTLRRQKAPSSRQLTLSSLISLSFVIPVTITLYFVYSSNANENDLDVSPLWFVEAPIPSLIVVEMKETPYLVQLVLETALFGAYFSVSLVYKNRIQRLFLKSPARFSGKIRNSQRQLSRAMLAQIICLMITTLLPRIFRFLGLFVNFGYSGEMGQILECWFPIFNQLSLILFIKPFRIYCLQFFCFYTPSAPTNSVAGGPVVFTHSSGSM